MWCDEEAPELVNWRHCALVARFLQGGSPAEYDLLRLLRAAVPC